MAKKNVQPTSEEVEVIAPDVEEKKTSKKETKAKDVKGKDTKNAKSSKNTKNSKNKKERKSVKKRASEVWSELKKVSRPSFGKVVKNTCVVIAVVAICTLLLLGMDNLFRLVYKLLLP